MPKSASDIVGDRLRDLRKRNRLTVQQVAEKCAAAGAPELTANSIYAIESGRRRKGGARTRDVTVDEFVALAAAFSVGPNALLPGLLRECETCHGEPPAGFTCRICGAEGLAAADLPAPAVRPARRRNRITRKHLGQVAGTYRQALAAGDAPTAAVAEQFATSHSTATRWVTMARSEGLLAPTTRGRAA